ncbi:MAG TPA: ATP-binding protein [Blastocatellia bacterium]|nr:ATP-binding protein [Blastocatellia bacterium]HMX26111.1 ATP-binding protein [Blastocatellia bacterium]HNG29910.1 ATP-binding protein [Blastocatellia bacterium]
METPDITDQRYSHVNEPSSSQMASSLRLSEARLAGILASAMDAIITVDEEQRIVLFNAAAEKMFRCPSTEVLGQPLDRFIPSRMREAHRQHVRNFGETNVTQRTMGKLRMLSGLRTDGEEFPIEASISQVDADGHKLFTVIIRDITEKKRLEAQFLRAQRMESIGTLAGGIAHDLNNVLSPILTAVELLQMRFTDESSQRLLNILHTNAVRGSEMVKQVLSFARGVEGDYAPLQPKHLIKEIVKILRDTLPKNIEITFSESAEMWNVRGDATQLHQVLMNLCVNARDAMPQGGKLHIEAENVDIDEQYSRMDASLKPGRYVLISVIDTGIGIPESNLSKIFDPFFTTKEAGQGTGLGLSTVAGIVRSHGGFVNVYSEVGRGTQFKIYLPAIETAQAAPVKAARADLPLGNGELVMVVDDEAAIRDIARETLLTFGYQVLVANDGTEALALYSQHKDEIRCVITDMMMPFLDGPATIRALRKLAPQLKIIATSGLKANGKTAEAAQLGVETFLQKPYTAEALLKALAAELRKK